MSGPPSCLWWLVFVSAGAGGLCAVVGVVSAVVDCVDRWKGRERPQEPAGAPQSPSGVKAGLAPPDRPRGGLLRLRAIPEAATEGPSRLHGPRQSAPQASGGPFPAPTPERPSSARAETPDPKEAA